MKIIYNDGHVAECPEDQELEVLRHSAAHIMAQAVKRLYPDAHFAYGPATEKGFHYDIDLGDVKLTDEDLPAIQAEMGLSPAPGRSGAADEGPRRDLQGRAHCRPGR